MKTKEQLIDAVIEHLREDILAGDVTVLEELLGFIEKDKLVQALPEEEWQEFRSSVDYFNIRATGFSKVTQREEIEINAGENGKLMIYKTLEGFVVDAYDANGENIDTMAIWEDGINPLVEDYEPFDPKDLDSYERKEFVNGWGQTHKEICEELGYWENGLESDDLIMIDYFWLVPENVWLPKLLSLYTEREEEVANQLRLCGYPTDNEIREHYINKLMSTKYIDGEPESIRKYLNGFTTEVLKQMVEDSSS